MTLGFAHHWLAKETMAFEAVYHPNLRLTLEDKIALLGRTGSRARCVWLYDRRTSELVGESYGMPVKDAAFEHGEEGYDDVKPYLRRGSAKTLYCYSTTILPQYQRLGLGKILKAYFLGMVSAQYDVVVGHARQGGSCRLNEIFGAEFGAVHPDWYKVGEPYHFYRLNLRP